MILIGELINGSRDEPKRAIADGDDEYIVDLAVRQEEAGADFIDVNPGTVGEDEVRDMEWLVRIVDDAVDVPLSFDSPNVEAIRTAFDVYTKDEAPLINSITYEQEKFERLLPIVVETGANVVALAMGDDGMPSNAEDRSEAAFNLVDALSEEDVEAERIFVDPIIVPISSEYTAGTAVLTAIEEIGNYAPECHITCGLSNVSYGLPNRSLVNRAFLMVGMQAGLDSAIVDPLDRHLMAEICAAEALLGRDEMCMRYISADRNGRLDV